MKRRIVLFAPALALVLVVAVPLLAAGRLPDPLATHFNDGPDGHTGAAAFTTGVAVFVAIAWAFLLRQGHVRPAGLRLTLASWVWAAVAFAAGIEVMTVVANLDAATWRDASLPFWAVLAPLAAGAAAGFGAHALERHLPAAVVHAPAARASVGLRPGELAVWSARVRGRLAMLAAAAVSVGLVLAGVLSGNWWLAVLSLPIGLACASVSEIVATVDRRGLTIAYGPLGWPRQTVPLDAIDVVEPTEIDPWRVGGWGYRKVPGRAATAVVIRAGEGIRVRRHDGTELLVTLPDAATAAGLLNDLQASASSAASTSASVL
ncbi:MAG TPA: hypothetical protein VNS09_09170 [Solirubrobacter sp.]|nr:hypothetical protein [Solirubrobacter sp.]